MDKDTALDLALEALEDLQRQYSIYPNSFWDWSKGRGAITAIKQALAAPVQEPVVQAWDEGYRAGIDDERTSEANIGIAGFDAKVEPARNNPYRTTPPAAQRQWVGLTGGAKRDMATDHFADDWAVRKALQLLDAHEDKLKELNT
jgi:hypothetical protein